MARRRSIHGFTLVELLVVISIIALLIAMLLPSLASARKAARVSLCGSQLRQNGIGFNAYQVDSAGNYPLLGGPVRTTPDIYGRILSTGDGGDDGTGTWHFNTAVFNNFGSYIGLFTAGGTTPMNSHASIKYCPVVDWFHNGAYSFVRPDMYGTDYANGAPGYSYFPGRLMNGSGWGNFNTIRRHDNPREMLMSDQLMKATQEDTTSVPGTVVSQAVPWFNPHFDRSCVVLPSGSAHELAADGHVANPPFTGTIYLSGWYGIFYFEGSVAGGNTNNTSRGSPWDATPACEAYPITP